MKKPLKYLLSEKNATLTSFHYHPSTQATGIHVQYLLRGYAKRCSSKNMKFSTDIKIFHAFQGLFFEL